MEILIFALLIALSAFFSASETAIFSISKFKVHALVREKKPRSASLARLKANPNRLLATILMSNTLVTVLAASLATSLATESFGSFGIGIATGISTIFILIFGESLPKTLAVHHSTRIALFVSPLLELLDFVLYPLVSLLESITKLFTRIFIGPTQSLISEEELKSVIAVSKEAGLVGEDTAEIMENVIEFEDVRVGEVMTPEVSIVFLDGDKTLAQVMPIVVKTEYSRFPVFLGSEENIVGVFDTDAALKEIQRKSWDTKVKDIAIPPFIVVENKKVADLLADFTKTRTKFAVVVDEHGSFTGVVSLEDVLEEIVGDIFDKSLRVEKLVKPLKTGGFEVKGSARVSDLEKILRVSLKGAGFTTLAGLIESQLGRIPEKGEKVKLKNFEIEVEDADERSIRRVRLYHLPSV